MTVSEGKRPVGKEDDKGVVLSSSKTRAEGENVMFVMSATLTLANMIGNRILRAAAEEGDLNLSVRTRSDGMCVTGLRPV